MAANIIDTDEQVRRSALQADFGPVPPHWPKYARMCELLMSYSGRLDRERLFSFLRDHIPEPKEASICGHNATLDGFRFSPTLNRAWFIPGPPCQHEASEYELSACLAFIDALIAATRDGLDHARVDGGDEIDRRVQIRFGHA
jgi:hypothetical protein